jgi:hypothetical protein
MPTLVHSAQIATLVNLCFIALALACACGLPARLADQNEDPRAAPDEHESNGEREQQSPDPRARPFQAK